MALQFRVQGLGKIEDAEINISPLTVITGPNGTGKSFFTKMIYSIFRMIEDISLLEVISERCKKLESVYSKAEIDESTENLSSIKHCLDISRRLDNEISNMATIKINEVEKIERLSNIINEFEPHIEIYKDSEDSGLNLSFSNVNKESSMHKESIEFMESITLYIVSFLTSFSTGYEVLLAYDLEDEIKENFQIESIKELINRDSEKIEISLEGLFNISFNDSTTISIPPESINFFKDKPNSIFFESPAYWRVRDALVDAKLKSGDNYLSGVPKYFFDLDSDLRKKSKIESELLPIHEKIKSNLLGEFIFESGNISFEDDELGRKISKNLVSFGMTNLGMVNALIKNNVIKKGSYVFIDEPETNLHPDWQVLMIQSLVSLSKAGVNVIITTHSTEILKYIEVSFTKLKEEEGGEKVKELLSVNFLDTDGTSWDFDSACPIDQTKEALAELSSSFMNLYMGKFQ